jgi:hypothetical protein
MEMEAKSKFKQDRRKRIQDKEPLIMALSDTKALQRKQKNIQVNEEVREKAKNSIMNSDAVKSNLFLSPRSKKTQAKHGSKRLLKKSEKKLYQNLSPYVYPTEFYFKNFLSESIEYFLDEDLEDMFPLSSLFEVSHLWGRKRQFCEIRSSQKLNFFAWVSDSLKPRELSQSQKHLIQAKYFQKVSKHYSNRLRHLLNYQFQITELFVELYKQDHPNYKSEIRSMLTEGSSFIEVFDAFVKTFCYLLPRYAKKEAIKIYKRSRVYRKQRREEAERIKKNQMTLKKRGSAVLTKEHEKELQRNIKIQRKQF